LPSIGTNCEHGEQFGSDTGVNVSVQSRVARLLIEKLSEECERYCILTGYEGLPDKVDTDIDFMVSTHDFKRIPALIERLAASTGTCLFQVISHELSARAFRLAGSNEERIAFIQPDSCSDYRHFGKLWLRADEMLAARRVHQRGFWIPSAAHEFTYYLIKRLNKRDFADTHGARLSTLYREDSRKCNDLLRQFWSANSANTLAEMAATGNWQPLMRDIERYRQELRRHSSEMFPGNVISLGRRVGHAMERILQPTGGSVAFIGPDGCGKSSVIKAVAAEFEFVFPKIVRFHLRPKSLPGRAISEVAVTNPHGQPMHGRLFSTAKMFYLFADYWLGHLSRTRIETARTTLVIFDRYFYDILVDSKRIRYGGPLWLPKLLARFTPRPDLVVLLDAPPEVLWSRKQEVPYEEIVRQQREYLRVAYEIGDVVVIDAAKSREEVVRQARGAIIEYLSRRTRRRLMPARTRSSTKGATSRAE
jgi:thymidylate kinase